MECRPGCGACCVAISISGPLPGLPDGKPAGVRCPNLDESGRCRLHETPEYPAVCRAFQATEEFCGGNSEEAFARITAFERQTAPKADP
jgi:Fe-S-cluster containining protein